MPPARVLVTGCAGFIGMHAVERLVSRGAKVTGIDNLDPYYDVALKEARLARLARHREFQFSRLDLKDAEATARLFHDGGFTQVVHLAAQPGVRYSLDNPAAYFANNLTAFGHVIEGCRPLLAPHFNLTVELPLKAIVRGYTWTLTPISWENRKHGVAKLKIKEMGSRYFFICMYVWLEKYFSRGDYRRK